MDQASDFEIGQRSAEKQLLIAYQGSKFKNAVTEKLIENFFKTDIYIKGIDISDLHWINPNHWDAIVLFHTWEIWQPPKAIETFVNEQASLDKVIVCTTSGDGNYHMEQVDAITSASNLDSIDTTVDDIIIRIEDLLYP